MGDGKQVRHAGDERRQQVRRGDCVRKWDAEAYRKTKNLESEKEGEGDPCGRE